MAHMNQERKQKIAPLVKRVLAKYGIKGTLSVHNHSTLTLTIKSGRINFCQNWFEAYQTQPSWQRVGYGPDKVPDHIDVNVHHVDTHFTGRARQCLNELLAVMNQGNHNNSDIQTDYFDVGWWTSVHIGRWNKPYIFEKVSKGV
jgi:hypothetical protein